MGNPDFHRRVGRLIGKGFAIAFIGATTALSQLPSHDRRLAMPLQTDKPSQAAHFPLLSKNGQSERAGRYFDYDKLEYWKL
jgi:hypothetical protein